MLSASAAMDAMIASRFLRIAASLTIDLPAGDYSDFTLSIVSINWNTTNTTDLPNGVAVEEGYAVTNGEVVLKGAVDKRDSSKTPVWLLNPDDPTSPLYRLHNKVKGSPLVFKWGARPDKSAPELLTAVTAKLTDWDVDADTGIITARFADVAVDWGKLPALFAVITDAPYYAGLTNEFVIDRIARNLPVPRLTWPLPPPGCVLAVSGRTSVWPEIGSLDTSYSWPVPTFAPCVNGSGFTNGAIDYNMSSSISGDIVIRFEATGTTGQAYAYAAYDNPPSVSVFVQLMVDYGTNTVVASVQGGGTTNYTVSGVADGDHQVQAHFVLGASSWSVTVRVDGATHSSGTLAYPAGASSVHTTRGAFVATGDAVIAAIRISQETAPTWDDTFTPTAFLDPSLCPLQAVPAIPAGTAAMDELQTIASSEGGYLFADQDGNLRFLNRKTITSQAPVRYLKQGEAMISLGSTVGATTQYDDIAIDYTEWSYGDKAFLFSPTVKWRVAGNSTQSWDRDLPDGSTAALVDGTIGLLPDGHDPTNSSDTTYGSSRFLAAFDKFGNGTPSSGSVTATVAMLTPSRVRITVTNRNTRAVWLVAPDSQVTRPVGTIALWIGGVPAKADEPTTVHVNYTDSPVEPFEVPSNPYRQDRDATLAYGRDLYGWLHTARPDYTNTAIRPDPRLQVADMVTVDLPISGGKSVPAKAIIWGQSIGLDFSSKSASHQISMRRFAPPGAWELGASTLGVDNYLYGEAA